MTENLTDIPKNAPSDLVAEALGASQSYEEWLNNPNQKQTKELAEALADTVAKQHPAFRGSTNWQPYEGPRGGEGWQNTEDLEDVRYQQEPPGETVERIEEDHWHEAESQKLDVEGVLEVFDNVSSGWGVDEENEYRSKSHASTRLIEEGRADPESVTEALIESSFGFSGDSWTKEAYETATRIGRLTSGPTEWGVNLPIITNDAGYVRNQAIEEFENEIAWGSHVTEIVEDGVNKWQLGMFEEECAPMFQVAADIMDNETLPEGGAYGDNEFIPSVMEMEVSYEEREAFEAKMEQTQEILREAFGETITVYRGINSNEGNPTNADPSEAPEKIAEAVREGKPVHHEHRPIESWSTNPGYAARYANGVQQGSRGEGEGVLIRKEVPVDRVMLSSHASNLAKFESEVIVMHDEEDTYDPDNLILAEEIDNEWMIKETLRLTEKQRKTEKSEGETEGIHISAEETDPHWLHENPPELPESVSKQDSGKWIPYEGPLGGEGWQNIQNPNDVRYQQDPPGETVEGYEDNFWASSSGDGYYDPEKWNDVLWDEQWQSPEDIPEGTEIKFETHTGAVTTGEIKEFVYGEQFDGYANDPAYFVVDDGEAEYIVTANDVIDFFSTDSETNERKDYDWEEPPETSNIRAGAAVLYPRPEDGVRTVGTVESVKEPGELPVPAIELENGDVLTSEFIRAVDQPPKPLRPRDEPYEFDSVRDPLGIEFWDPDPWPDVLQHTPFSELGEIPEGVTVEFEDRRVSGNAEGEVIGYFDGESYTEDEPNGLRVESDEVGETTVFPEDLVGFKSPGRDLDTAQYLSHPFTHAVDQTGAREAGIDSGNTTGEHMQILEMPDESRIFATPVDAYIDTWTGVVDGPNEAVRNNINSPIMINHLGGNACRTELVYDQDGNQYIAKEGIEGDELGVHEFHLNRTEHPELVESLEKSLAAAYFVGNRDLHAGNIVVNLDEGEATIIDHDSAGRGSFGWMDLTDIATQPADYNKIKEHVYDICRDYMRGDIDIPDVDQTHADYFKKALGEIVNDKKHDAVFEPWETSSHELVDGYPTMQDFERGMEVTVLTDEGRVRTAELTDRYKGTWYGETEDNYEISFDTPHNVLEIEDESGVSNEFETINEKLPEGYENFGDFEEGDQLRVIEQDGDPDTKEVVYHDGQMALWDPETGEVRDLVDYIEEIRNVESVNPEGENQ